MARLVMKWKYTSYECLKFGVVYIGLGTSSPVFFRQKQWNVIITGAQIWETLHKIHLIMLAVWSVSPWTCGTINDCVWATIVKDFWKFHIKQKFTFLVTLSKQSTFKTTGGLWARLPNICTQY